MYDQFTCTCVYESDFLIFTENKNQSTVSTANWLASLFWYLIALTTMKLHVYGTRSTMYMYVWSKQILILYFKNLLFLFLVDFNLLKSS